MIRRALAWPGASIICVLGLSASAAAQPPPAPAPSHVHPPSASPWHLMQDSAVFATFNRSGGPRGATELTSQNWWMGMAERSAATGDFRMTLMLSLEPLTMGGDGYSQLFQLGESYAGKANVDRQHPHDFLMQASASWRWRLPGGAGLTVAGAPVGEAALGPVSFMHRLSAAENPTAPLGHHTFDSTHITMGVLTVGTDVGPFSIESSVFQGREPDEQRWDLMDGGAFDSYALRAWFRRGPWVAQVSHGFLDGPERLDPVDIRRTTASISWTRRDGDNYTAISVLAGRNRRPYDDLDAVLVEGTHRWNQWALYARVERVIVETEHLIFPDIVHQHHPGELIDPVTALTVGAVRDVARVRGHALGLGADATFHDVPHRLTFTHATAPKSLHIFLRLRPSAVPRMPDMTMTSPVRHAR